MSAVFAPTITAGRVLSIGHYNAASSGRCSAVSRPSQQILSARRALNGQTSCKAIFPYSQRHRWTHLRAADKAAAEADVAEETTAEDETSSEEQTADGASETSEESAFAELMRRARSAIESGEQAEQDAVLQEVDTQLNVSAANAEAADKQLQTVQDELKAQQDKYLRLNAEFDNFRKRSAAEKSNAVNSAKANVIEELLSVIDAFEAAAQQVKAETEGEQKIMGSYQGLYAKMVDAFKKMGLEVVPGVGTPFDPEVHEAIMRAPSEEYPDGTVLQEFRRGFRIGGQLLRPAMVQIAIFRHDDWIMLETRFRINGQVLRPVMVQVSYSEDAVAASADDVAAKAELDPSSDDTSETTSSEE